MQDDFQLDVCVQTTDAQAIAGHKFKTFDNPIISFTDMLVITGDQVDEAKLDMKHWTYMAVRSKDSRVIDAVNPLTQRAKLEWRAHLSGTIDAAGVYALTGSGVTGDASYADVTDGSRVPGAEPNINDIFAGGTETWSTV